MNVVHIFWGLGYGGIETMLVNIANSQAELGAEVSIIIINDIVEPKIEKSISGNVKLYRLNRKKGSKSLFFIFEINRLLNNISPDVVHTHRSEINSMLLPRWRKKSCCTLHDLPKGRPKSYLSFFPDIIQVILPRGNTNVFNIHRIPQVYSISSTVKEELYNKYNIRSLVIYNGINTSEFKQRKETIEADKRRVFRIVQVSRLMHLKKGQDLLIEAVGKLQEMCDCIIEVDFIGDGDSKQYLQELIIENNLSSQVHLLGSKSQEYLQKHLCDYDLFIQPSRFDGFGLTVAEAMSAKLPVLVSSGQGPEEIICGEKYGWVFHNNDVESLVDKIKYIITHTSEAEQKAEGGFVYASTEYEVKKTALNYLNSYKNNNE